METALKALRLAIWDHVLTNALLALTTYTILAVRTDPSILTDSEDNHYTTRSRMISFDDPPGLRTHASWVFSVVPVRLDIIGDYTAFTLKLSALSLSIRSRSDNGYQLAHQPSDL